MNRYSEKAIRSGRQMATLLLFVPALLQAFPVFYILCLSFKVGGEAIQYPPELLPKSLDASNYIESWHSAPLARFLLNSALVSIGITLLQITTSVFAAFALARMSFKGQKWVLGLIVGTMMVPGEITIIPNYFTMARWGWLNTYAGLIMPFSASGFGVFLLYQFFKSLPKELEEAAAMDGVSPLRFLFQFAIPLSLPAVIAFGTYSFVNAWNMYLWPLVVTQTTSMQTAQIGLGMFRSQTESMSWGIIMAATVSMVSPTVLLFIATQKQFVKGITMSGIKG